MAARNMASVKSQRLIVASSETSADMLYATGFHVPDPFVFVERNGRTAILLSDLEIDRGRRDAAIDSVQAYSEIEASLRRKRRNDPAFAEVVAEFLRKQKIHTPEVPSDFPAGLAMLLEREGVAVHPVIGHFWPQREFKTPAEIRALSTAQRLSETGLARATEILKTSTIRRDRKLSWKGTLLTSERLRAEIESAILYQGGFAANNTIVAGGNQACDPHERGHGPLFAHQLIILDIFPRSAKTGFFGDVTRTVVRGRANADQRRLWETCLEGQNRALQALKPGVSGKALQDSIRDFFTGQGYPTELKKGRWQGFFHGLGHGLGLEIHEEPRLARTTFQPGQCFTVEPGIYIHGIGGVRHEDVAIITETGRRLLSRFPKQLEL